MHKEGGQNPTQSLNEICHNTLLCFANLHMCYSQRLHNRTIYTLRKILNDVFLPNVRTGSKRESTRLWVTDTLIHQLQHIHLNTSRINGGGSLTAPS